MERKRLEEIAEYFCAQYARFSVNPPIDRQDTAYRVSTSDLTAKFPELSIVDLPELHPHIKRAMRKHKLHF